MQKRGATIAVAFMTAWLMLAATVAASPERRLSFASALSPEQFVIQAMQALYAHPGNLAQHPERIDQLHDRTSAESSEEVERVKAEALEEQRIAAESGFTWRDGAVTTTIRSVTISPGRATVEAEVRASWQWGYPGQPSMTTQVYNLHELDLVQRAAGWQIVRNRNLASAYRPRSKGGLGAMRSADLASPLWTRTACDASTPTCAYNRLRAQEYAFQFWAAPNPAYVNFGLTDGGDCTNFASQVVVEGGGYPMAGPESLTEWWYRASSLYSWPWALANENQYWMRHHYGDRIVDAAGNPVNLLAQRDVAATLQIGDLIYYAWATQWSAACACYLRTDDFFDHTAVVTGYDTAGSPLVTYRNAVGHAPKQNVPWLLTTRRNALIYGVHMKASIANLPS